MGALVNLFGSKKFQSVLCGVLVQFLILVLVHFWPDLPSDKVAEAMAAMAGLFGVHILSQGYADGKTGGLTSSSGQVLLDMVKAGQMQLQPPVVSVPPANPVLPAGGATAGAPAAGPSSSGS